MIKDSKLIGTKIKAPFGWKKFKVGELFDKQGPIVDRTVADFSISYSEAYRGMNYINCATAGVDNNGCPMIVSRDVVDESYIINNCITVSANGVNTGSVFVQTEEFCVLQDSYALIFKHSDVDVDDYLFVASLISKYREVFDYQVKAGWARLSELSVEIPVTSANKPDFEWMSAYIRAVKADYLDQKELSNQREIKDYLTAGNVDSTDVTDDDRQFLRDFEKLPRRKFKVGELFDKLSSKFFGSGNKFDHVYRTCTDDHNVPILYAKYNDNGIMYWAKPGDFETHSNCIGVIYNGAVSAGRVFAQKSPTGVLAESYLLSFKYCDVNFNVNLYLSAALQKVLFSKYSREYLATWNKVQLDKFELPVIANDEVDVQSIEKYMQIQIKLAIGKHAKYLDKELALMKTV